MKVRIILLIGLLFAAGLGISAQNANSDRQPIEIGAIAPDFTLTSSRNEQITLSEINRHTVLLFYRGYW
ncbi:MAG: redoxin domain-containing protein [Pyrinomonadaceae bacterium]|nr:redoxin domain-containing protein [Pyrinomonadaceae bacterium]